MSTNLKNILFVIGGFVVGSIVNMAIVFISFKLLPLPEGFDMNDPDMINRAIESFKPVHFVYPLLAHGLGTLAGAFFTARFVSNAKLQYAMIIGLLFFIGGIMNMQEIIAPMWFNVTDLIVAYFPMAWLGYVLAGKSN